MTSTANVRCSATNRRGEPCQAYPVQGSRWCYWHDPAMAEARARSRAAGGAARHGRKVGDGAGDPVEVSEMGDVLLLVNEAIRGAWSLENSIQRSRTLGYLAGQAVKALQLVDLEERVANLERVVIIDGAKW